MAVPKVCRLMLLSNPDLLALRERTSGQICFDHMVMCQECDTQRNCARSPFQEKDKWKASSRNGLILFVENLQSCKYMCVSVELTPLNHSFSLESSCFITLHGLGLRHDKPIRLAIKTDLTSCSLL